MVFNDAFILKLMSRSGMVILTIQYYMKFFILTNTIYYWMRLITMWRILQIEENAIHQSWRPTGRTVSEICIILHIIQKLNSLKKYIVLIVIQNISKFLTTFTLRRLSSKLWLISQDGFSQKLIYFVLGQPWTPFFFKIHEETKWGLLKLVVIKTRWYLKKKQPNSHCEKTNYKNTADI